MPWVKRPLNGSFMIQSADFLHRPGEETGIKQVQDRVFDAADILVDRQPAIGRLRLGRLVAIRCGEASKIPGTESTNVSIVSVSRFAGPPHFGQAVSRQVG